MSIRVLDKTEWQAYCDRVSKGLSGKRASIEISGLSLGHQTAATSLPLLGIAYEPRADLLEIALEGLDHLIRHPRRISVDDGLGGLRSMEIVDAEDRRQIVQLTEPLMLTSWS